MAEDQTHRAVGQPDGEDAESGEDQPCLSALPVLEFRSPIAGRADSMITATPRHLLA